ncbi:MULTISPECIES: hypothetical protein [Actinomadura]|uniref:Uncharacterized protein n=1 Tax=Actinomadura yumaensis TaxID=111807 RepID=A0ABW2CMY3_9ACTN|nr:hypothetical protein [Actinomadura sp. J1-007]
MSNALANPRRTKLDAWPERRTLDSESEQGVLPTDSSETSATEDERTGH